MFFLLLLIVVVVSAASSPDNRPPKMVTCCFHNNTEILEIRVSEKTVSMDPFFFPIVRFPLPKHRDQPFAVKIKCGFPECYVGWVCDTDQGNSAWNQQSSASIQYSWSTMDDVTDDDESWFRKDVPLPYGDVLHGPHVSNTCGNPEALAFTGYQTNVVIKRNF
jgi:hypothetical protein